MFSVSSRRRAFSASVASRMNPIFFCVGGQYSRALATPSSCVGFSDLLSPTPFILDNFNLHYCF